MKEIRTKKTQCFSRILNCYCTQILTVALFIDNTIKCYTTSIIQLYKHKKDLTAEI